MLKNKAGQFYMFFILSLILSVLTSSSISNHLIGNEEYGALLEVTSKGGKKETFNDTDIILEDGADREIFNSSSNTKDKETETKQIQNKVGIFIQDLYEFNIPEESFKIIFWLWWLVPDEKAPGIGYEDEILVDPTEVTEITNSKSLVKDSSSISKDDDGLIWATQKYRAKIAKKWDSSNYPFDRQKFTIKIEETSVFRDEMIFVPDVENSLISPDLEISGWRVLDFKITESPKTYHTKYGDPNPDAPASTTVSQLSIDITLQREGWTQFVQTFFIPYFAFGLSLITYFISFEIMAARLVVISGAIFAVIGNKISLDQQLPVSATMSLVDKVILLTFCMLLVANLVNVLGSFLTFRKMHYPAKVINIIAFITVLILYPLLNALWVYPIAY